MGTHAVPHPQSSCPDIAVQRTAFCSNAYAGHPSFLQRSWIARSSPAMTTLSSFRGVRSASPESITPVFVGCAESRATSFRRLMSATAYGFRARAYAAECTWGCAQNCAPRNDEEGGMRGHCEERGRATKQSTGLLRVARNDDEVGRTPAYQPRPPRQKFCGGGGANSSGWR